jgi:hypothetical protein
VGISRAVIAAAFTRTPAVAPLVPKLLVLVCGFPSGQVVSTWGASVNRDRCSGGQVTLHFFETDIVQISWEPRIGQTQVGRDRSLNGPCTFLNIPSLELQILYAVAFWPQ